MSLSHDEAAQSLRDIEQTKQRSIAAMDYAYSSPGFILWGLVWMAGYSGTWLLLRQAPQHLGIWIDGLWFVLVTAGVIGSAFFGRRRYKGQSMEQAAIGRAIGRRIGFSLFAIYVFIFATFLVMRPINPAVSGVFIPLIVATIYVIYGLWRGPRFLYVGLVLAGLTLIGWYALPYQFLLWMAVVGGGALILTGLWMRKA